MIFSTYSGSFSDNFGYTATYDSKGFLYSGSTAFGDNYPVTTGAYQQNYAGGDGTTNIPGTDIALSKYDTTGTSFRWSTYLGGSNDELPHSLIVNSKDELFVFGTTSSPDFPVTSNAYDTTFNGGSQVAMTGIAVDYVNGSDIIVSRLSNDGTTLQASTFIGGSKNDGLNLDSDGLRYNYADEVRGEIIIDDKDNVYIGTSTYSNDFPVSSNAFQKNKGGGMDGCIIKLDNELTFIQWSSYFGGSGEDAIFSLNLNSKSQPLITGGTQSSNIPTTPNAYQQNSNGGRSEGFIAEINKNGKTIDHSTYWGTDTYDQNYFVRSDVFNNVYVLGQTHKMDSSFIKNASYSNENSGQYITKFNPQMDSIIWSTVFGSGDSTINISPSSFMLDLCRRVYLSGWGGETNIRSYNKAGNVGGMPITNNAYQSKTNDSSDFYLFVMKDDASGISYGSYFGGS
ncbi:MAG: hypothetical protein ABEH43_05030, partial [Flavobacteriales bacterium]